MKKILEIAVVLSAVDRMSTTINDATNKSIRQLRDFHKQSFTDGLGMMGAGAAGLASMAPMVQAFSELEDSSLQMKAAMLRDGNEIDENFFKKLDNEAVRLGNILPGTTADMHNLFTVMLKNGVTAKQILSGVGESAAFLSVQLKIPFVQAGELAARLKNSTGTADKDMMALMDTIARINQVGPQVDEVTYAFQRASGGMKALNIQGLENTKVMGNMIAQMIQGGMGTGETIGTGFKTVFNELLNPKSMAALNAEAAKFGVSFKFFDKGGQFLGLTNFISQMDQLKNFDPITIHKILEPLSGPQGNDLSILVALAQKGTAGFNKMNEAMFTQATLNDKVKLQLGGLKNTWEAATGTFTNMMAALGGALAPELKRLANLFNKISAAIGGFAETHPKVFKFIGIVIAGISSILIIAGAIKMFSAAMWLLNIAMAANPFILAGMAIVAVLAALYVWWDKLKYVVYGLAAAFALLNPVVFVLVAIGFIAKLIYNNWDKIWSLLKSFGSWLKKYWVEITAVFLPFVGIPLLIFKHWDTIKGFFSGLLEHIKSIGSMFFDAGKNIVMSIVNGIKGAAHHAWDAIKNVVKGMRDYLPFSPAKVGPFKDLHKVKIVETIAGAMNNRPALNAMRAVAFTAVSATSGLNAGAANNGGGGVTIHYAPVIHMGASTNKDELMDVLKKHERELVKMVEDVQRRDNRLKHN